MRQIHGPFRLSAGQHIEDVPSGVKLKVAKIEPSFITAEDGTRFPIDRGAYLIHDNASHALWRGDRRVSLSELVPGDEIELAHEVTYGAEDVPQSLRRIGVVYGPFMSTKPLDTLYNRPNAMKFYKATDVAQGNEIEELRRQVAELRERLAEEAVARQKAEQNPSTVSTPPASSQNDTGRLPTGGTGTERQGKPLQGGSGTAPPQGKRQLQQA